MEANSAGLSALRINRSAEPAPGAAARRWVVPVAVAASIAAGVAVALFAARRSFGSALEVHLTPATLVSPGQADAVLVASGYVVAQRKAAVASKGTGRLVYLGVVEGDKVQEGQIIARLEDSDVRAQLAQAEAQLQVNQADLQNAEQTLKRTRALADSNFSSQAALDSAQAHYLQVKSSIAVAQAVL